MNKQIKEVVISKILPIYNVHADSICDANGQFYILFSDMLDGFLARKLKQESRLSVTLDSIADFIFVVTILIVIIKNVHLPMYLW